MSSTGAFRELDKKGSGIAELSFSEVGHFLPSVHLYFSEWWKIILVMHWNLILHVIWNHYLFCSLLQWLYLTMCGWCVKSISCWTRRAKITPSNAALSHYTQRHLSSPVHTALKPILITWGYGTICLLIEKGISLLCKMHLSIMNHQMLTEKYIPAFRWTT